MGVALKKEELVLFINKPHFEVKLHPDLLEVDLKKGFRKAMEDVLEAKPFLRETLGFVFQSLIPLDVPLHTIDSVKTDRKGLVKLRLAGRKDVSIPLEVGEAKKLVDQLNELIPIEKQKEYERIMKLREAENEQERLKTEALKYGRR